MKYKHVLISILVLMFSLLSFRAYQNWELSKLHHRYEISLAKALKNSYRDIEEIHFEDSVYSDKPGDWHTNVTLIFLDETKIKYLVSHSLYMKTNYSASIGGKHGSELLDELSSRKGKTISMIRVIFSNKEMEEIV